MNNKEVGDLGEKIAFNYLIKNGYKIINRNQREGFDEIDIVAKSPDGTLLFIEVKTVTGSEGVASGFMPEDQLTGSKLRKIARACQRFSNRNVGLVDDEKGWRIDLIAITLETALTGTLHHYKNI